MIRAVTVVLTLLAPGVAPFVAGEQAPAAGGQCAVDAIFGTFATGGYLSATGFAFDSSHGAPVRKVELTLDGAIPGEVTLRGLRPDVLAHFARSDYLWAGWNGEVSLEDVPPGEHTVDIVAIDHEGRRIPCGRRSFTVVAAPEVPSRPAPVIGAEILLRTALFLGWIAIVGSAAAVLLKAPLASAPFLGLALFGVFAEAGGAFHVKPSVSALTLTVLGVGTLVWLAGKRRIRIRLPSPQVLIVLGISALFAIVAVIPLAAHGEGAVLGDIDDASREGVVADSLSRYGWKVPPDVRGYYASMRQEIEKHHVRLGGIYLLATLADVFGTRAHAVHSVAMLAAGCLAVWGAGLLARALARRRTIRSALAAGLVAANSTIVATLYGQHLGSLLAAALVLPFLAFAVGAGRPGTRRRGILTGVLIAGIATFYPESLPVWVVAAIAACALQSGSARRFRAVRCFGFALIVAVLLSPTSLVRFARFTAEGAQAFTTSRDRIQTGDTHYFPGWNVVWGIEAYREDARAPLGGLRRFLVPAGSFLIAAAVIIGWARLSRRERANVAVVALPVALALAANLRLEFPYGYAKFLPMAAAVWSVVFVELVGRGLERPARSVAWRVGRGVMATALVLAFGLALPSLRHVVRRAVRSVPAYDAAYRDLPALGRSAGRDAVILVDEPVVASREWMRYFLGDHAVLDGSASAPAGAANRTYRLVDRRRNAEPVRRDAISGRTFLLLPLRASGGSGS